MSTTTDLAPVPTAPASGAVPAETSRRDFFRMSAIVAALGTSSLGAALLDAAPAAAAVSPTTFTGTDLNLHLLRRTTYGPTKQLVKQVAKQGRTKWLNKQLAPETIADDVVDDMIAQRYPRLSWSIQQAVDNDEAWELMMDQAGATIARAAWSKRQLFEVMVDFWANHLNVTNPSDNVGYNRHDYDQKVIRKHALGKFSDMLVASATHPAMMLYLNNAESTKDDPNENYGRELLELHSVGVDGGYDEEDMRQSTLIMTGFGIDWDTYGFEYHSWAHHRGPVSVLGFSHQNSTATGGYDVGLAYVRYLAKHGSTALRIARKLATHFVSDTPPQALVDRLADTYLDNDTAMVPVLRQLFTSAEFNATIGQKVRRPYEDLIATIRALGIKADGDGGTRGIRGLYWMVEDMGHPPQGWPQPDGFPDFADGWRSAGGTLAQWNSHISLAAHWWPDQLVLPPLRNLLPETLPTTYGGYVDALSQRLVNVKMAAEHRQAVLDFLGKTANSTLRASDEALKWRFPYVVALILDSPYHKLR